MIIYRLDDIIDSLATAFGETAHFEPKFGQSYYFYNVDEQALLDAGFTFEGYSNGHIYPMYKKDNLSAVYQDNVLYIYENPAIFDPTN